MRRKQTMIGHTNAYRNYKQQNEELFDFLVLICYAVPTYKQELQKRIAGNPVTLPPADHFQHDRTSDAELLQRAQVYKKRVGCFVMLSAFSYFESYVAAALREMLAFHGGELEFVKRAHGFALRSLRAQQATKSEAKRKLQEPATAKLRAKHEKYIQQLAAKAFRFPSDFLAPYGLEALADQLSERRFKPVMIPSLLTEALSMDLSIGTLDQFTKLRRKRNDIAHGTLHQFDLSAALDAYDFLRAFATDIDKHLVETFFVLELYR